MILYSIPFKILIFQIKVDEKLLYCIIK